MSKKKKDWNVTARIFAEAYERHDAGEYSVQEFTRGDVRWVVSVSKGHIEAHSIARSSHEALTRGQKVIL